jgi:hypothetical protein
MKPNFIRALLRVSPIAGTNLFVSALAPLAMSSLAPAPAAAQNALAIAGPAAAETGAVARTSIGAAHTAGNPAVLAGRPVAGAASSGERAGAAAARTALRTLAPHVRRMSDPDALRTAFEAYYAYRDAHPDEVRNPYLYFVDLGLSNATSRGYVFDMEAHAIVEGPFMVAHGRGSGPRNGVPTKFTNRPGSYASSLGLYLAQETYTFTGKSNGRRYSSVGLRMRGESGQFNGAARARGIVAHGAPYVSSREAGRSEGCPAMEPARANRLLPKIANGGVVFIYSPKDTRWLRNDPWVNAGRRAI